MADHQKAQNVKPTKEAAHQRRTVEPVGQEWIGLQPVDVTTLQRAVANPGRARPADILNLQRAYGNRAVSCLLGSAASRRPRPVIQPYAALREPAPVHTIIQRGLLSFLQGKGELVNANIAAVSNLPGALGGHSFAFSITIDPHRGRGENYPSLSQVSDIDIQYDPYSLFGVTFEWWERTEYEYKFVATSADTPTTIADKRTNRTGGSVKPWNDLYALKPHGGTFSPWAEKVPQARAGSLQTPFTVDIIDRPSLGQGAAGSYRKRMLRFRLVAKDQRGKQVMVLANQVLVEENNTLAYSFYEDSVGNHEESGNPAFATQEERHTQFNLPADFPPAVEPSVPIFAKGIKKGIATPFDNLEVDAIIREFQVDPNMPNKSDFYDRIYDAIILKGQGYSALHPPKPGQQYYQYAVGGGLLVALAKGKEILRMYYTDNTINNVQHLTKTVPTRKYVEYPVEQIR